MIKVNDTRETKPKEVELLFKYFDMHYKPRYCDIVKHHNEWRVTLTIKEGSLSIFGDNKNATTLNSQLLDISRFKFSFSPKQAPGLSFTGAVSMSNKDERTNRKKTVNETVILIVNKWTKKLGLTDKDTLASFLDFSGLLKNSDDDKTSKGGK